MNKLTHQAVTLVKSANLRAALRASALWCMLATSGVILAADAELPEMEFLEYLGLWEESDEDWVLISEGVDAQAVAAEKRTDPASTDDESAEIKDES